MYYRSKHVDWFEKFTTQNAVHNHVKAQENIPDRTEDLQNINISTLIIHGQEDNIVLPRLNAQLAAKLIPNFDVLFLRKILISCFLYLKTNILKM